MAANNYFGYTTHGQPGYGAYSAAAPTVAQATSAAAQVAAGYQAAVASAPAAAYRTTAAPGVVAYTAYQPPQCAVTAASYVTPASYHQTNTYAQYTTPVAQSPVHAYDGTKATAYFAQPACVAPPVTYTVSDPHYQARPVYTTNSNVTLTHGVTAVRPPPVSATGTAIAAAAAAAAAAAVAARVPRPTYTYSTTYAVQSSPSYTYAVQPPKATVYTQAPPNVITPTITGAVTASMGGAVYHNPPTSTPWNRTPKPNTVTNSAMNMRQAKPRPPTKPMQLQYCEVCKISCAGPQTYKEHLEGQKHKKKEAASKSAAPSSSTTGNGSANTATANSSRSGNALRCELCDVTCTGSDAYAAHIRGAKHQKVMKLHTKLGKPIPPLEPTLIADGADGNASKDKKVVQVSNIKKEILRPTSDKGPSSENHQEISIPLLPDEKDIQPVGADYIDEVKSDDGKLISFNCKLCDCKFNDPNAKEMHMKGRRHRLQYKKKVNPDLVVDVKANPRQKKMAEDRAKRANTREDFWRRREEEFRKMEEEERMFLQERRMFDEELQMPPDVQEMMWHYGGMNGGAGPRNMRGFGGSGAAGPPIPPMPPSFFMPPMMRRPETIDDRHVIAKHAEIYPGDEALAIIQKHVSNIEKALKGVSDALSGGFGDKPGAMNGNGAERGDCQLKGVMRVGVLAKGLLLKGDSNIQLVLLCSQHPTVELLQRIASLLPSHIGSEGAAKYEVSPMIGDAAISVTVKNAGIPLFVEVSLTSPVMREAPEGSSRPQPANALNKDKCLKSLAALRHAKWFQARAASRQSCVMVIRVLRDLCARNPTWRPVKDFLLELLTERVLSSVPVPLPPGDALRRVFEALSGGLLLPDSPGFLDPCEKDPRDVSQGLTPQERENLTCSAQSFLRLMAFRQIHEVLEMDPLPVQRFTRTKFAGRKRGAEESSGDEEYEPSKRPKQFRGVV